MDMRFHLREMTGERLQAAAAHFNDKGFFVLDGLEDSVTPLFRPIIAEMIGVDAAEMEKILDPESDPVILPVEVRQRLSRIDSTPELAQAIFATLGPVFQRLLGPVVHVSSTFHGQFKGGEVKAVDHGGYGKEYLEVQGQYLIHQDFTGARIPTSPAQLTLWVAQNTSPDWNLRLYPESHRQGLLCHQWLALDDPRLAAFGTPIDIPAKLGTAVIFNSLLLHASSNPGPRRRISCDIRFFPLCGFLPSQPYLLGPASVESIRGAAESTTGDTLRAPLLETLAYLGEDVLDESVPPHSILNWANYLHHYVRGDAELALPYMERFVNTEIGMDTPDIYTSKFHNQPIHQETIARARALLASSGASSPVSSATA
jgi:hypothetical protein